MKKVVYFSTLFVLAFILLFGAIFVPLKQDNTIVYADSVVNSGFGFESRKYNECLYTRYSTTGVNGIYSSSPSYFQFSLSTLGSVNDYSGFNNIALTLDVRYNTSQPLYIYDSIISSTTLNITSIGNVIDSSSVNIMQSSGHLFSLFPQSSIGSSFSWGTAGSNRIIYFGVWCAWNNESLDSIKFNSLYYKQTHVWDSNGDFVPSTDYTVYTDLADSTSYNYSNSNVYLSQYIYCYDDIPVLVFEFVDNFYNYPVMNTGNYSYPLYLDDNAYYSAGYNAGLNSNQPNIYNSGYLAGDSAGYSRGYGVGYEDGSSSNYTFFNLIGATIDVPLRAFTSLLNFNILGVNLLAFITSILTVALVIFVIKKFISK